MQKLEACVANIMNFAMPDGATLGEYIDYWCSTASREEVENL